MFFKISLFRQSIWTTFHFFRQIQVITFKNPVLSQKIQMSIHISDHLYKCRYIYFSVLLKIFLIKDRLPHGLHPMKMSFRFFLYSTFGKSESLHFTGQKFHNKNWNTQRSDVEKRRQQVKIRLKSGNL